MTHAPHLLPPERDGAPPSTARTLGAWLDDPDILRPPRAVVPHLAIEGRITLLSGREKIGKSTLAAGAVAAASHGASWLGGPLEGGGQ